MAFLAGAWPEFAKAGDIARATGITVLNVQKTASALGQAGLAESLRGRNGGLRLARKAQMIHVSEIVRAFEPGDCPASFLMLSEGSDAISALLLKAHRDFFRPLEAAKLSEITGGPR